MQRHEIIKRFTAKYGKYGATEKGIEKLVDTALSRGYDEALICYGLERVLCRNYTKNLYTGKYASEIIEEKH